MVQMVNRVKTADQRADNFQTVVAVVLLAPLPEPTAKIKYRVTIRMCKTAMLSAEALQAIELMAARALAMTVIKERIALQKRRAMLGISIVMDTEPPLGTELTTIVRALATRGGMVLIVINKFKTRVLQEQMVNRVKMILHREANLYREI